MGLLDDSAILNPKAEEAWTSEEVDKLLNLFFEGTHPKRIAHILGRNPKAIKRRLEQLMNNERDHANRYQPVARNPRSGKLTTNEKLFIRSHKEKGISVQVTARILQRPHKKTPKEELKEKHFFQATDLVLAMRYLYYVKGMSLIDDETYDRWEKIAAEETSDFYDLKTIGSDKGSDCPDSIKGLALYLSFGVAEGRIIA